MTHTAVQAGAYLHHIAYESANPKALAEFYSRAMDMELVHESAEAYRCEGPRRRMVVVPGENKKLAYLGVFGKVEPAVRETHKNARTVIMIDDAQFEGKLRRFNKSDAEFHGAYVTTKDMDLAENVIASAQTAREAIVLSDSQLDFSVDLTGSAEALNAAKQCLAEQAG